MEPCIARCIFYIANEMQLIQLLYYNYNISALRVSGGFSAHHQEPIKLYVQPWVLSCFPAVYRCLQFQLNSSNQSTPAYFT
jgi:hypothetical protein